MMEGKKVHEMTILNSISKASKKYKIKILLDRLNQIEKMEIIMPIEIFSLANKFSKLEDVDLLTKHLLIDKYIFSQNHFVKRVLATTFRFLEVFDNAKINRTMLTFLDDNQFWVIYDAIWYFQLAKTQDEEVINKITSLSKMQLTAKQTAELLQTSASSDNKVNMIRKAKEFLEKSSQVAWE